MRRREHLHRLVFNEHAAAYHHVGHKVADGYASVAYLNPARALQRQVRLSYFVREGILIH